METAAQLYRTIFETSADAILVFDEEGIVTAANDSAVRRTGRSSADLVGSNIRSILRFGPRAVPMPSDAGPDPVIVRAELVDPPDDDMQFEISLTPLPDPWKGFCAILRPLHAIEPLGVGSDFFQYLPVGCYTTGPDGRFTAVNRAGLEILGYRQSELVGKLTLNDLVIVEHRARLNANTKHLERYGILRNAEYTIIRKDGQLRQIIVFATAERDRDGRVIVSQQTMLDVTERRRLAEQLEAVNLRFRSTMRRNLAGFFRCSLEGSLIDCNEALARMLGYSSREELLATSGFELWLDRKEREVLFRRLQRERELTHIEVAVRRRDGTPAWAIQNLDLHEIASGDLLIEGTMFDVTDRKLAQEQVDYQTHYDNLTGLPNPALFEKRLEAAMRSATGGTHKVALLFLDLDQFKLVNESLGHNVGNELLQLVAFRLQRALRNEDTVTRLGGDDFTIVASVPSIDDARVVAQKALNAVSEPYLLAGRELMVTASIGVALYPDDSNDAETLLRFADVAMYRAKESGRSNFVLYSETSSGPTVERMTLESDLRQAIERDQLQLYFQPKVDCIAGRIVGFEALLRWKHPDRGIVMPTEFIPIAERTRLIISIGEWVIREACSRAAEWSKKHPELHVSVNLSPRQFVESGFAASVRSILEETTLPPHLLELEITEGTAMQNPELALETLQQLKQMGVRISIDDFGTGYSALSYLTRFPIDTLKIDQGFVREIERQGGRSAIISAVIALAHELNLQVVAEGVETEAESTFLKGENCGQMQGFLFSHPLPWDDLMNLLSDIDH